ncbi:MAG: RNA polymerase sigma-70 factor [Lewinellaceae bacterium]|nr:RNA polymerase sigma-70 factor [Lewinellaceae bacterium]
MSRQSAHIALTQALYEQLFKAHFVALCHFANQLVQDMDSARDIAQKVFINLWENRETIDPQRSVQSYLYTSVRNRCLNHIRDRKKYRSQVLDLEIMDIEISFEEDNTGLEELQKKIAEALSTLPEKCRQVFEMSRFQDMKYKDIAAQLDISEKTVEAHMSKALKTLREELKEYFPLLLLLGFLYKF